MKLNSITNRYILKEMLVPFSINIFIFAFLFLMTEMIEIANWIVNYNLSLWAVLTLILYTLPAFLIYIIPMAVIGLFFLFQTGRERSLKIDLFARRLQLILDRFHRVKPDR